MSFFSIMSSEYRITSATGVIKNGAAGTAMDIQLFAGATLTNTGAEVMETNRDIRVMMNGVRTYAVKI